MLSRACFSGVTLLGVTRVAVRDRVIAALDDRGTSVTPLAAALAACSLLNVGHRSDPLPGIVANLARTQDPDGAWPRSALYLGPAPYYGSEELTTALCVETLARYLEGVGG
jgi:hypothetical protein